MGGCLFDPVGGEISDKGSVFNYFVSADVIEAESGRGVELSREQVAFSSEHLGEPLNIRVDWGVRPVSAKFIRSLGRGTLFLSTEVDLHDRSLLPRKFKGKLLSRKNGEYTHRVYEKDRNGMTAVYHVVFPPLFLPTSLTLGEGMMVVFAQVGEGKRLP